MSDEPLTMGTLEKMMSRMMQSLAKTDEVKELSSEVKEKEDNVNTRLDSVEDDVVQ